MERLTKIYPSGGWEITGELDDAILRLAAYEETGLEPEDIKQTFTEETALKLAGQALGVSSDRLRELAEADREGRCVVQPRSDDTQTAMPAGAAPIVYCKDCAYLRYSDFYGECSRGLLGMVGPLDYCRRGRVKEGSHDNETA